MSSSDYKLGTLEFCSALNGDDPNLVLSTLKLFVKTVKEERHLSLQPVNQLSSGIHTDGNRISNNKNLKAKYCSSDTDDDYKSDYDNSKEDQSSPPPTKKVKKTEYWKLDTKAYNVPFVGTSTVKGSSGIFQPDSWPTGFLAAYLHQSPQALELLLTSQSGGADNTATSPFVPPHGSFHRELLRNKKNDPRALLKSARLYCLYILSLGELVTCGIPKHVLKREISWRQPSLYHDSKSTVFEVDESQQTFNASHNTIISSIMKKYLSPFINVLNDESKLRKRKPTSETITNLELITAVINVLCHLSCTSIGAAREVARSLDSILKEGILKLITNIPNNCIPKKNTDTGEQQGNDVSVQDMKYRKVSWNLVTSFMHLASLLLEIQDSTITSLIISPGNKESKTKTGIAYVTIRFALLQILKNHHGANIQDEDEKGFIDENEELFHLAILRFMKAIRRGVLSTTLGDDSLLIADKISCLSMVDFFKGEPLDHILRISIFAPSQDDNTIIRKIDNPTLLHHLAIECRNIRNILLSDIQRSPFLSIIHTHTDSNMNESRENAVMSTMQYISRSIQSLTKFAADLSTRKFIMRCLETSPSLLSHVFRTLQVIEPKASFECLSSYSFINMILKNGPSIMQSVNPTSNVNIFQSSLKMNDFMHHVIPKGFTKVILSKALQNNNKLVVVECLKLIENILQRSITFMNEINDDMKQNGFDDFRSSFVTSLQGRLPDMQVLLSVRSKCNPFSADAGLNSNVVVNMHLCQVLMLCISLFPSILSTVQFDWIKLLPDNSKEFFSSFIILQQKILRLLLVIFTDSRSDENRSNLFLSSRAFSILARFICNASNRDIINLLQEIATHVVSRINGCDYCEEEELKYCLRFEASLWIHGLSEETIEALSHLIDTTLKVTVQHNLAVSKAWTSVFTTSMPDCINFSPMLSVALMAIVSSPLSISEHFVILTSEVISQMLMYQKQPMLLATLTHYLLSKCAIEQQNKVSIVLTNLRIFAESLMNDVTDVISPLRIASTLDNDHSFFIRKYVNATSKRMMEQRREEKSKNIRTNVVINGILNIMDMRKKDKDKLEFFDAINYAYLSNICSTEYGIWLLLVVTAAISEGNFHMNIKNSIQNIIISIDERMKEYLVSDGSCKDRKLYILPVLLSSVIASHGLKCDFRSTSEGLLKILVKENRNHTDNNLHIALLATHIDSYISQNRHDECMFKNISMPSLFLLWYQLTVIKNVSSTRKLNLQRQIETIMTTVFLRPEYYTQAASHLLQSILDFGVDKFISTVMHSFSGVIKSMQINDSKRTSLCKSLLIYDLKLFWSPVAKSILTIGDETNNWDEILVCLIQSRMENKDLIISDEIFSSTIEKAFNRGYSLMKSCDDIWEVSAQNLFSSLVKIQSIYAYDSYHRVNNFQERVHEILGSARGSKSTRGNNNNHIVLFDFLIGTISSGDVNHNSSIVENQYHVAIKYIIDILPSFLRKKSQVNDNSCTDMLLKIEGLVIKIHLIDGQLLFKDTHSLRKLILICLKYGMSNEVSEIVGSICIRVVRSIISMIFPKYKSHKRIKDAFFGPSQIHSMVVSHSNFDGIASNYKSQVRVEMIELLVCNVTLDSENIVFEQVVIRSLMRGFNAGLSYGDLLTRKLLHLYSIHGDQKNMFYFDELIWGSSTVFKGQGVVGTDHAQEWECFVTLLDKKRISKTVTNFPLWDTPDSNHSNSEKSARGDNIPSSDEKSDDESISVDSSYSETDSITHEREDNCTMVTESKSINHDDERYSPGFIMPLLLELLSSLFLKITSQPNEVITKTALIPENSSKDEDDHSISSTWRETVVKIVARLAQKGLIALSLICLSSRSPYLRKVSIGCLHFFIQTVHMDEAHSFSSWRERPQIEMLLNSVQRGLTLRRSTKLSKNDDAQKSSSILVPMFPLSSALFLARSYFILTKPGDDMYGPVNRFFLRLEECHGAYIDCHSLPAFISLYCSVANDTSQASKERLWALQLLKDGIRDGYSYKVAARRHAPELLMTSFDNLLSRGQSLNDDKERHLILECISSMLEYGGKLSLYHLIITVGVIPWIQSLLQVRISDSPYATYELNIKILTIIQKALQVLMKGLEDSDDKSSLFMVINTLKISRLVVEFGLEIYQKQLKCLQNVRKKHDDMTSSLLSCISDIIWILCKIEIMKQPDNKDLGAQNLSPSGTTLSSVIDILEVAKSTSHHDRILVSFFVLPMNTRTTLDSDAGIIFIEKAIHYLINKKTSEECNYTSSDAQLFGRISTLVNIFIVTNSITQNSRPWIDIIFGARCHVVKHRDCLDGWLDIMTRLMNEGDDKDQDDENILNIKWHVELLKREYLVN